MIYNFYKWYIIFKPYSYIAIWFKKFISFILYHLKFHIPHTNRWYWSVLLQLSSWSHCKGLPSYITLDCLAVHQGLLNFSPGTAKLFTLICQAVYLGLPSCSPGTAKLFTCDCQSVPIGLPSFSPVTAKLFNRDCQAFHLGLPSFSPGTAKLFTWDCQLHPSTNTADLTSRYCLEDISNTR